MARFLLSAFFMAFVATALSNQVTERPQEEEQHHPSLEALIKETVHELAEQRHHNEADGDMEQVGEQNHDPYQQLFFEFQKRLAYEREQEQVAAMQKRFMECKKQGEGCRGLPKCCGDLQCYWPKGYSMFHDGECVKCVAKYQKCQRDDQCCQGTICDKGNALWVDGRCVAPRSAGGCYRDEQCVGKCEKKWWQISGSC